MRLLTPRGTGGIAVVLAAPGDERAAVLACLRDGRGAPVALSPGAVPRRCVLQLGGDLGDDVLAVDRPHGLELHLHGSLALLDALAAQFGPLAVEAPTGAAALQYVVEIVCVSVTGVPYPELDGLTASEPVVASTDTVRSFSSEVRFRTVSFTEYVPGLA